MNRSQTKSVYIGDCEFPSGINKRQRRRRRNRFKNCNLKKKKQTKFSFRNKTSTSQYNSELIMSNWYWSNYRKAVEWQERHKVAHWKACALALFEENRYLLEIINQMQTGVVPRGSATPQAVVRGINNKNNCMKMKYSDYFSGKFSAQCDTNKDNNYVNGGHNDSEGSDEKTEEVDSDVEFEMSEEMMQFFEQSYKHKMEQKKLKEKEMLNNTEHEIEQIQNNKIKRSTEMNYLYGDGASMITGMETAVQLSFNKYCDIKSPKYWPNIPFKL